MRRSLFSLLVLAVAAAPATGQDHTTTPTGSPVPYWLHVTPQAGAVVVSRPGRSGRPLAALQLEVSHILPMGVGLATGYWLADDDPVESGPDGPFAEALFVYRFHLRAGGRISPYAGPVAGIFSDDAGGRRVLRGYFGARGGVDIRTRPGWPALRVEAGYRRISEADGPASAETTTVAIGARWSIPTEL